MKATPDQAQGYYNLICNIIRACNFESYLELGVDTGYNIKLVSEHCKNLKRIVGVDMKPKDTIKHTPSDARIKIYSETSTDYFFQKHASEYDFFDCVFIDACHEHKQVLVDYENCFKMVPDDGIIFLHDTYPPDLGKGSLQACGDSYKAYLDLKKDKNIDIINLPIWVGLTIIRKHTNKILKFL